MMTIPATADDFTPDWLNQALAIQLDGAKVTACHARKSDIPGQTAEVIMMDVSYDRDTELPGKMVAKVTSEDPIILSNLIAFYDQYRRETSFYREFPDVGISVPQCLFEAHNPETQEFVLLMGDLAPAASPSWAINTEQVELALSALPSFHARWWNHPELRQKDWMVQYDEVPFYAAAFEAAKRGALTAAAYYDDLESTIAAMRYAHENQDKLLAWTSTRPFTFVHGDYHAKQMFFPTNAGGEFSVIDWQFPFVAAGPWDFARLEGMCLETHDRRAIEPKLMAAYLEGLKTSGVTDYSKSDFEADYRYGLFISQVIMSVAHADTDVRLFEAECGGLGVDWKDAMLVRTQSAMQDWNVVDFLKQL